MHRQKIKGSNVHKRKRKQYTQKTEEKNTYKEKYEIKNENMKGGVITFSIAHLESPNSEFTQLGVAHMEIAQLGIPSFDNLLSWESLT
uniref:Uncharacterized protein n=1 Tax=Romanomermis culicivorax TaxID=13658 RepID=A0A915IL80_ROMCU